MYYICILYIYMYVVDEIIISELQFSVGIEKYY